MSDNGAAAAVLLLGVAGFLAWQSMRSASAPVAPFVAGSSTPMPGPPQQAPQTASIWDTITSAWDSAFGGGDPGASIPTLDQTGAFTSQQYLSGAPTGIWSIINAGGQTVPQGNISVQDVYDLANTLITANGFAVTPEMATAIAIIESGDISHPDNGCNPKATRYESGIKDSSAGLMQTLSGTAHWLYTLGYTAYGDPALADLYNPQVSMYFGLAYLDYLRSYGGQNRSVDFMVQSYNAGPGHTSSAYLDKFNRAVAWLQGRGM